MAVYEQTYRRYDGALTPEWNRFLIIPRHAYRAVFGSKLFTAFFLICFLPLLVEAILIYLHHNFSAIAAMKINVRELVPIDAFFFQVFINIQGGFAFFVALLVGPPLVSRDLRNNALPLYLCRPFSRTEYVLGKMSVILILISVITWVPQLLLFLFQAYLEGFAWFRANIWMVSAIVIGGLIWAVLLALLTQTISALVKWRVIASGVLLGIFFIPTVFGAFVNEVFRTRWGNIVSLGALIRNVTAGLFGTFERVWDVTRFREFDGTLTEIQLVEPPLWASWFVLFVICAVCLALLSWKVKAYEVVR
jgi:ABC-2 type transport system permease protein